MYNPRLHEPHSSCARNEKIIVDSPTTNLWTGLNAFPIAGCLVSFYYYSACIKGSLGVRDSQKLPWDFQKSAPGSLGLPSFKDI